jgi:chemotaxis protein CheD
MLNSRAATKPERPRPVAGFEDIACAWDVALGHWCAKILPGEFYITRTDEAITTVLGSCISACIRDRWSAWGHEPLHAS